MMLIHTCARVVRGMLPGKNDTNGAIWCIMSVPKHVTINLKINNFNITNQQPKFCAIFFSMINPDAHVSTKINALIYYKGSGGNRP